MQAKTARQKKDIEGRLIGEPLFESSDIEHVGCFISSQGLGITSLRTASIELDAITEERIQWRYKGAECSKRAVYLEHIRTEQPAVIIDFGGVYKVYNYKFRRL